jgi:hypothetical protein
VGLADRLGDLLRREPDDHVVGAHHPHGHVAADRPAHAAEHLALDDARARVHEVADPSRQLLVIRHQVLLRSST